MGKVRNNRRRLAMFFNWKVEAIAKDGRTYKGILMGVDKHMNLVLHHCDEFRFYKVVGEPDLKEEKRNLGLMILRGDDIITVNPDRFSGMELVEIPAKKINKTILRKQKTSGYVQSAGVAGFPMGLQRSTADQSGAGRAGPIPTIQPVQPVIVSMLNGMNKDQLVEMVRNLQKADPVKKKMWEMYCIKNAMGQSDPEKHESAFIRTFFIQQGTAGMPNMSTTINPKLLGAPVTLGIGRGGLPSGPVSSLHGPGHYRK